MLVFNKLLPLFVLPTGVVLLLVGYSIWRRRRWPAAVAFTVLYLCSMRVTAHFIIGRLEGWYPPVAIAEAGKADAIVVLSGIFGPPSHEGHVPNLGETVERLEGGIALWKSGVAPWLVFTGARLPWTPSAEVEGMKSGRLAVERGVTLDRILVTDVVANTADEASAVALLAMQRGWKRVVLVTTAWHMPRAARLFRKAGVEFEAFPVDYQVGPDVQWHWLDFLPTADALRFTETGLRELYGLGFYALTGR